MTRRHVPDLVTENADELGFVGEERQDAAGDVNESTGDGKRVDRRLVDDGELPGQAGALGRLRQAQPEIADVPLQRGIVVDAHLGPDLRVGFAAERDLLRLAHQRELAPSRHRVRRAGGHEADERDRDQSGGTP
ncbi:hypothetical protein D3C83_19250 [compost metagenome]